jgi:hypothetical protein
VGWDGVKGEKLEYGMLRIEWSIGNSKRSTALSRHFGDGEDTGVSTVKQYSEAVYNNKIVDTLTFRDEFHFRGSEGVVLWDNNVHFKSPLCVRCVVRPSQSA